MGYYSDLTITVTHDVASFEEIEAKVRAIEPNVNWDVQAFDPGVHEWSMTSNAKWYDSWSFALQLSRGMPGIEFQFHRLGEGMNEEWDEERYKAKDGKVYDQEVLAVTTAWVKRDLTEIEVIKALEAELGRLREKLAEDRS